jgi:hypothetical protein
MVTVVTSAQENRSTKKNPPTPTPTLSLDTAGRAGQPLSQTPQPHIDSTRLRGGAEDSQALSLGAGLSPIKPLHLMQMQVRARAVT